MTKHNCDRCGKETENFVLEKIPDGVSAYGSSYKTKKVQLCGECYKFIDKAERAYNAASVRSRIEFFKTLLPELYKGE